MSRVNRTNLVDGGILPFSVSFTAYYILFAATVNVIGVQGRPYLLTFFLSFVLFFEFIDLES